MQEFDYANFDKVFNEKIQPKLKDIEHKRRVVLLKDFGGIVLIYILWELLIFFTNYKIIAKILSFAICILALILIIITIGYIKSVKRSLYTLLFNSIGFRYTNTAFEQRTYGKYVQDICDNSNMFFLKCNCCQVDDIVTGRYKDLYFNVLDIKISHEFKRIDIYPNKIPIFWGIVLATKINKNFSSEILIKTDRILQVGKIKNKKRVKLEDIEFEKKFEVYSNDQIDARYVLTTSFINRLLNYKKKRPFKAVEVYISNDLAKDSNVFFFINTHRNNFEVPIFRSIINKKLFYNILRELTDALDVINELKLEQNIGL